MPFCRWGFIADCRLIRRGSAGAPILAQADVAHPGADDGERLCPARPVEVRPPLGRLTSKNFYNESPLIAAGNSGSGSPDCVALIEDSDYLDAAVTLFATTFGFPPFNITRVLPDGTSPGINGDETEALLDIDYAHATAPATPTSRVHQQRPVYFDPEQRHRQCVRRNQHQLHLVRLGVHRSLPGSIRCSRRRPPRASPCSPVRAIGARPACSTTRPAIPA